MPLREDRARTDASTKPVEYGAAVTPSDSADLTHPETGETTATRGLYIGTTGDVAVHFAGMTTSVTLTAVAAGVVHPVSVGRVLSTGTTATDIVALW